MKYLESFPEPRKLKVDKKGAIYLTDEQWAWFAEYLHAKDHRLKYQRAAIKAFVCGCLDVYVREHLMDKEKQPDVKKRNSKA